MRYYVILLVMFLSSTVSNCQPDYFDYHIKVIAAEDMLIHADYGKAFKIYSAVFKEYDFVFPRDCIIAAEFAYHKNKKLLALEYLEKAFLMGVMPSHLQYCPIFKNNNKDSSFFIQVEHLYTITRNKYLNRVDKKALIEILDIKWNDQLYKNINPAYTIDKRNNAVLDRRIVKDLDRTIQLIKTNGNFPGQSTIGIPSNDILQELGIDSPKSLLQRYTEFPSKDEYHLSEEQFDLDHGLDNVSNDISMIALYHHPCAFSRIGGEALMNCIKNGSLHPNDYAVLYEIQHIKGMSSHKNISSIQMLSICPETVPYNEGYGTVLLYSNKDTAQININRKAIGMRTIDHVNKLQSLAKRQGIIVQFGYMEWK